LTRVAVLGPGAVGGTLAVRLAEAGVEVVCVARRDTAAAIRSQGLTLRHGSEMRTAHPEVTERLEQAVDLLLITVKAPALDAALERVVRARAGTAVPLLNGLEHVQLLRERLDARVVAGSIGRFEAYRDSPATVVQTTSGAALTLAQETPAALLRRTGFEVRVEHDEGKLLWSKVARLAPLAAATSIAQRPVGELREDTDWRRKLEAAVRETCSVAAADGVVLDEAAQWEIIDAMPQGLTTSTARDIAAGRPSELDAITGSVVRAGRRLGVGTPVLGSLLTEAEDSCRVRSR
jgi:2-dehydropantoate 2-reductase